ncbi:MAG: hypothetical protein ACODAU_06380 [Myxococcota bacterium]
MHLRLPRGGPALQAGLALGMAVLGCDGGPAATRVAEAEERPVADVLRVRVAGAAGAYTFRVTVRSPDRGCDRYADWWEVIRADGTLVHRRILHHSHVDEQPFTRGGGPVDLEPDERVFVRAHMHSAGYGGAAVAGTAEGGFERAELPADFAPDLERAPPQPEGCSH